MYLDQQTRLLGQLHADRSSAHQGGTKLAPILKSLRKASCKSSLPARIKFLQEFMPILS